MFSRLDGRVQAKQQTVYREIACARFSATVFRASVKASIASGMIRGCFVRKCTPSLYLLHFL